jgi:hypothetical protein
MTTRLANPLIDLEAKALVERSFSSGDQFSANPGMPRARSR